VNVGCYRLPGDALDALDVARSARGEYELTDVLARVCERHRVAPATVERWQPVGRPWELLAANEWRLADVDGGVAADATVAPGADLRGTVRVESGARVEPGVVIEGPTLLGRGAHVGPNAYVRGATLLGPDSRVGHAVEVKNSVLMRGATVGHLAYVGDSVLGREVNLGAGTTVANLRHDGHSVSMRVRDERVDSGRRKLGVVAGDGAKTGVDTAIDAGVRLGPGVTTPPGATVTEDRP
jgi:bifunctional UDP-N-acetylglucosamine pyrophosphorylase/glucosamine-1-phosphate N-acetyltransferase